LKKNKISRKANSYNTFEFDDGLHTYDHIDNQFNKSHFNQINYQLENFDSTEYHKINYDELNADENKSVQYLQILD
jgi:hypothetical protein